ncbi:MULTISPECIES: hypothetical protein [Spirulina sp. CCY15215]|uniref:hypothetical protein n=1 Tax=Spirulina sp. CCY15215 TaxID=2767591 RepID=UPI00194E9ABA|nr:hypothetical protein [Spirulina major]
MSIGVWESFRKKQGKTVPYPSEKVHQLEKGKPALEQEIRDRKVKFGLTIFNVETQFDNTVTGF